jgi:D-sedoheptulose 7-phosphate isomerase
LFKETIVMLGLTHDVGDYLERLQSELDRLNPVQVHRLADLIHEAWANERFIFVFGNGGSGATASHFAEDLGKNALRETDLGDDTKPRPRVMSLTDNTSWITALANDLSFDQIFLQQLMQYARAGDLVIAISGSGNSPNVLAAVQWANGHGLKTFGLTGYGGGQLKQIQQDGLHVPLDDMGMVESIHLAVLHWIVEEIHARVNRVGRHAGASH